jgi:hypothetical protein
MIPPGAPMSGLSARSGDRPYELNEEIELPVGLTKLPCSSVQVMFTGPVARRPSINTPSVSEIITTGIVIAGVPSTLPEKRPVTLLYRTTAMAPAFCALSAFW